jgi:excisionase family DNA binding protein
MTDDTRLTLSVPEAAAKYFGLSRKAAYALAAKGALPTVRLGRTLRVPVAALERMLAEAGKNRPAA